MSNQAQIDALEHLLLAMLKHSKISFPETQVFGAAQASIMGSDGPGGPKQKTEAAEYLKYLKSKLH